MSRKPSTRERIERKPICCGEEMPAKPYQSFDGFSYKKAYSYKCKKCGSHYTSAAVED